MKIVVTYILNPLRPTSKNYHLYVPTTSDQVTGTLYFPKGSLPTPQPEKLQVTIEAKEG